MGRKNIWDYEASLEETKLIIMSVFLKTGAKITKMKIEDVDPSKVTAPSFSGQRK